MAQSTHTGTATSSDGESDPKALRPPIGDIASSQRGTLRTASGRLGSLCMMASCLLAAATQPVLGTAAGWRNHCIYNDTR